MGLQPTPTNNNVPLRTADFSSLADALDYAARGKTGYSFYDGRGRVTAVLSYEELREQAQCLARRLLTLGLERGSRVALIADTHPDFQRFFFACQYAGLAPVPLPLSFNLGNHDNYVAQLRRLIATCDAAVAIAPHELQPLLQAATQPLALRFAGSATEFLEIPEKQATLRPSHYSDLAYIQYTSGSTRFPRGVMITQQAVLNNLSGIINYGVQVRPGDRCVSWLPFYHDMGLVGLVLGPLASQLSVDYIGTRDFAMRPRQWLTRISEAEASISFSPPFGYDLCARRLRDDEADRFDLSAWRVAGVGAETIRPEPLLRFAHLLEPAGFDAGAFLACYGMAECSLAVSFAPLGQGLTTDMVDTESLAEHRLATPVYHSNEHRTDERSNRFVNCGAPLPDHEVLIRDVHGKVLPERHCGTIYVRGPSVMSGYFNEPDSTAATLSAEGWLNTGDIGYRIGSDLVITGRQKDLMIINGRNIWPQDLEYLAEQQPEIRPGDVLAFSVPGPDAEDVIVVVVQSRESDQDKRENLITRLQASVHRELSIDCMIELVPFHTLPRTSSGKLSRARARQEFIERVQWPLQLTAAADTGIATRRVYSHSS